MPAAARYQPGHIAGDAAALSPRQRERVGLAAELGQRSLAPRAALHDREASFPHDNYRDLREAGLLGLCVPESHGGLGADFFTHMLVVAELGRHCGATALTFNMHGCACLWEGPLADGLEMSAAQRKDHEAHRAQHFERVVKQGKFFAQPFSEGGAAAVGKAPWSTVAKKVEGGYLLSGRKLFASSAGAADYYGVLCTLEQPGATLEDTLYLLVPADAVGVSVAGDWDPMGMRATVSRDLVFHQVFVRDAQRLLPEGVFSQAARRFPFMFSTLSAAYFGIAQAAYDFTVQYLRAEVPGMPPVQRRAYPTKQITVAQMRIQLEQTRALFLQNAREARLDPDADARMRMLATHYTVVESAQQICALALRTCGGHSMMRALPLERFYRDARCGAMMLPWTAELCLDRLGHECLYDDAAERTEEIE